MAPEAFDNACLALPGATLSIQWGDDHVFKVGDKMFAVRGAAGDSFAFKASEVAFEVLTESGRAKPAPYLARAQWVWFPDMANEDEAEVVDWLASAHALIAAKLTKKARAALGIA